MSLFFMFLFDYTCMYMFSKKVHPQDVRACILILLQHKDMERICHLIAEYATIIAECDILILDLKKTKAS